MSIINSAICMQIHLATNCTDHFKIVLQRKCPRFNAIIQKIIKLYKEKWLLIQQFQLVANLSVLATDIRFCDIDLKALRRAKWHWFVVRAGLCSRVSNVAFQGQC